MYFKSSERPSAGKKFIQPRRTVKIAKEGLIFIVPSFTLGITFLLFRFWIPVAVFFAITCFFGFFFRDPERKVRQDDTRILSPADGKIIAIQNLESHPFLSSSATVVSIFLSLFDVHITRAPVSGVVTKIETRPGDYYQAYKEEAGAKNKSKTMSIKSKSLSIIVKQIVGFAARRLKYFVHEKDEIQQGQRIGLMYFGSRVDLFLGPETRLTVGLNQRVKAGESEIAVINT